MSQNTNASNDEEKDTTDLDLQDSQEDSVTISDDVGSSQVRASGNDDASQSDNDNSNGQDGQSLAVTKDGDFYVGKSTKRKYIVEYHRDACIGAASCAAIAPLTFEMDEENKALIIEEGEWDDEEIILAAAQSCPVFAIIIKDAETGEQIFPEE